MIFGHKGTVFFWIVQIIFAFSLQKTEKYTKLFFVIVFFIFLPLFNECFEQFDADHILIHNLNKNQIILIENWEIPLQRYKTFRKVYINPQKTFQKVIFLTATVR